MKYSATKFENAENIFNSIKDNIISGRKNYVITLKQKDYVTSSIIYKGYLTFTTNTIPAISIACREKITSLNVINTYNYLYELDKKYFDYLKVFEFNTYDDIIKTHRDKLINLPSASKFFIQYRDVLEEQIILKDSELK